MAWSSEKIGRELTTICPKPTKRHLRSTNISANGKRADCTDENGKNRPKEVSAFYQSTRFRLAGMPLLTRDAMGRAVAD